MGFLKKLFGEKKNKPYVDKQGIYFYVQVNGKESYVRVRADRQHDLQRTDGGFVWHKTIVDSKYFRRMSAVVQFDNQYNITHSELDGGTFISKERYETATSTADSSRRSVQAVSPPTTAESVSHPTDE